MFSSLLDSLERAFYGINGEGHPLDRGDIRRTLLDQIKVTADTPIWQTIDRLEGARSVYMAAAVESAEAFRSLCSTLTSQPDFARPAKGVTIRRHGLALMRALRDELAVLELLAALRDVDAALDALDALDAHV